MPGEFAGCTGCHEDRLGAPPPRSAKWPRSAASPRRLNRGMAPSGDFNYLTEVQPVFDRHCVRCHDYGRPRTSR